MSRQKQMGICKLRGKEKKLTFEHVPPAVTFNSYAVKMITGETLLKEGLGKNLPWENKDSNRKI